MVNSSVPGKRVFYRMHITKRETVILLIILGIGALALFTGVADAAMRSIQLNSPASFPVDI